MSERHERNTLLARLADAIHRYRTEPLSAIEYTLIQDILKNSRWYALWLVFIFGIAMYALWGHVPTLWLLLFLVLFGIEVAIKINISQYFEELPPERQREPVWRLVFDAGSTYSGLVYGLASLVLFYPLPNENRLLLIGAFCALISNLSAATAFFTPISRTMLPSLAAPVILVLLFSGRPMLIVLALLGLASIACTIFLSRLSQARYRHVSRLNQENKALVDSLSEQQSITVKQQARAEQAVIDKSRFLAIASHDLRQPLHALGLFHHALRLKSENDSNRQLFESIDKSTDALNAMFDSLLDVSRLDAKVVQPEIQPVQLEGICSVLQQEFSPIAEEKGLSFDCEQLRASLLTDGTLLARILRNLISNAIKFTEKGGVTIRGRQSGTELTITVRDTGPGIPESERNNVFSEFYQLGGGESFGTVGAGLGLSIVKRLCELLDIGIEMKVADNGGTVVSLRMECLPASEPIGHEGCSSAPEEQPGNTLDHPSEHGLETASEQGPGLRGRTILFIDDDPQIRQAMSNMLNQWGCLAICEPDVQKALSRLNAMNIVPDLLVCDFQLASGNSGVDAIRVIHEGLSRELPAILVSGASGIEETHLIDESGYPCLTKPVAAETLREVIERLIVAPGQPLVLDSDHRTSRTDSLSH